MNKVQGKRSKEKIVLYIISSFVFSLATVYFPLSNRIDFNDGAIYQYIGYLITKGKVPYIDAFDHKGMYLYLINTIGYLINPKWGMWIIIWLTMFGNMLAIDHIANRFLERKESLILTIVFGSCIASTFWDGNTPDYFSELFVFLAFDYMCEYIQNRKINRISSIIIGGVTGIIFWMKPNMVLSIGLVCCVILFDMLLLNNTHSMFQHILYLFLGFQISTMPIIIYLYANDALKEMIKNYFIFNIRYSSYNIELEQIFAAYSYFTSKPIILFSFLLMLTMFVIRLTNRKFLFDKRIRFLFLSGVVSFTICLFHISMTGNQYPQYILLLYPSVEFLIIACILEIKKIEGGRKWFSKGLPVAAFVILVFNLMSEYIGIMQFWSEVPQEHKEIEFIKNNSCEKDTIAVISPFNCGYYLETDRDSATKYIYIQAHHYVGIESDYENEKTFWEEYTDELSKLKPRAIIYDKGYLGSNEKIKAILNRVLNEYTFVGESELNELYFLPRNEEEILCNYEPVQYSNAQNVVIPDEMIQAYKKGEIEFEEFMKLYDESQIRIS